jgi:hypothetical protein
VATPAPGRRLTARPTLASQRRVSLCETLDRVLNKGAVVTGDIVISVAGVDLLYLGLNLVVTSVETMRHWTAAGPAGTGRLRAPAQEPARLPPGAAASSLSVEVGP